MTVVISMLRGINLGSHNRIKMEALRALYESLGFENPQTHVQSGNVLFKTEETNLPALAKRIETGIEQTFGIRSSVILRTSSELRDVIARNPFAGRPGIEPSRLLVNFLATEPSSEVRQKVQQIKTEPEELKMHARELYVYYPNGMARPKLPWARIERTLNTPGTGRNWNSVTKMLALAEKLERA